MGCCRSELQQGFTGESCDIEYVEQSLSSLRIKLNLTIGETKYVMFRLLERRINLLLNFYDNMCLPHICTNHQ